MFISKITSSSVIAYKKEAKRIYYIFAKAIVARTKFEFNAVLDNNEQGLFAPSN